MMRRGAGAGLEGQWQDGCLSIKLQQEQESLDEDSHDTFLIF